MLEFLVCLFVILAHISASTNTSSVVEVALTQGSAIRAVSIYDAKRSPNDATCIFTIQNSNITSWSADVKIDFLSSVDPHDDPLSFSVSGIVPVISIGAVSINVTFPVTPCYRPKIRDTILFVFSNASTTAGVAVRDRNGNIPSVIILPSELDSAFSGSVLVASAVCLVAVVFLLHQLFDGILALNQLQLLIIVSSTTCAPYEVSAMFTSVRWVVWPAAAAISEDIWYARCLLYIIATIATFFAHSVCVYIYRTFITSTLEKAITRMMFPGVSFFVSLSLFLGAVTASIRQISAVFIGSTPFEPHLSSSIAALVICMLTAIAALIAVFKIVSKEVYRESRSPFQHFVHGGEWQGHDISERFGVLYQGLNGNSFWFFVMNLMMDLFGAIFAGMLPASRSFCSRQQSAILVPCVIKTLLMFSRRPFRSGLMNTLNLCLSILMCLLLASFLVANECSVRGTLFATTVAWLTVALILAKLLASISVTGFKLLFHTPPKQLAEQQVSVEGQGLLREDILSNVPSPFEEPLIHRAPALQQPVLIGSAMVSRVIGFGKEGGVDVAEGPSSLVQLRGPKGLCCDENSLYVCDTENQRIVQHHFTSGRFLSIIAEDNGTKKRCSWSPTDVAIGDRCLYVTDCVNDCLWRIDIDTRRSMQLLHLETEPVKLRAPTGICEHSNYLFISDTGNHRIVCYNIKTRQCKVVFGTGEPGYSPQKNPPLAQKLTSPKGVCVREVNRSLLICDSGNHRVLAVPWETAIGSACDPPVTVAGIAGLAGETQSGIRIAVESLSLCLPTSVDTALHDGRNFIVDCGNSKIWCVTRFGFVFEILPSTPNISPIALCYFNHDAEGECLFVTDAQNGVVLRLDLGLRLSQ